MSTLDYKQSKQFVEFYKWLYWDENEELPIIYDTEEERHKCLWRQALTEILWKTRANKIYTHRWWYKEKYVDWALSWLWLQYWPKVLDYNKAINGEEKVC